MKHRTIDISTFKRDADFYGDLDLLVTIKSFDLQAIRKRYLQSRKRSVRGSVERREPSEGGVISLCISGGEICDEMLVLNTKEPRGVANHGALTAYSSENEVHVEDDDIPLEVEDVIKDDYLSYIHSLDFSPDGKRLLVCSSGFDCIFEYDICNFETPRKTWEWFAWDHGIDVSFDRGDTVIFSRLPEDAKKPSYRYIDGSEEIPTAARAAFINTATYDTLDERFIFATLFHHGEVWCIHKYSGNAIPFMCDLKSPHGGHRHGEWLIATSTGSGQIVMQNEHEKRIYDFSNLPGKPDELGELEWIQNSRMMGDTLVAIDSNRTSFVLLDIENELIDIIPYPDNWAVQDMAQVA